MGLGIASITISAMNAGFQRLATSADNVARRHVPNSEKNRVLQKEQPQGGVATEVVTIKLPENQKSDSTDFLSSASNIDYAEEAIERIVSVTATQASLAVYNQASKLEEEVLHAFTGKA